MNILFEDEWWTVVLDHYRINQAPAILLTHETKPPCHVTLNADLGPHEVICAMYWMNKGAVLPLVESGVLTPTTRTIRRLDQDYTVYQLQKEWCM